MKKKEKCIGRLKNYLKKTNMNIMKFQTTQNLDTIQSTIQTVGAAAHSYINAKRFSNSKTIEEYIKNYNYKDIEEEQDKEGMAKEYMMLGLRKIQGVSISAFERKFQINPLFYFRFEISKLVEEDLIEIDLDNIKLTHKGLDLANLVFEEFI